MHDDETMVLDGDHSNSSSSTSISHPNAACHGTLTAEPCRCYLAA
jgi:hypothetical protein